MNVVSQPRTGRKMRSPQHSFHLLTRPFVIQPMLLAPVLAGETMKNMLFQARVVSDPLSSRLIGWWCEYYFFYVRARHLFADNSATDTEDAMRQFFVDPTFDRAPLADAVANVRLYYKPTAANKEINWASRCLRRVVEGYFRDDAAPWNEVVLDGMPLAYIQGNSWCDSLQKRTDMLLDDPTLTVGADDVVTGSEVERLLQQWQYLKEMNLTDMTYEDYLVSFGVKQGAEESTVPELIRYVRDWAYPVNTVDPATGAATTAASWSLQERADKDRFFKEPGFVFGVQVVRPKTYRFSQREAAANQMFDAYAWLPPMAENVDGASIREISTTSNFLSSTGTAVSKVWDVKDLLLYGDQFVNFDLSTAVASSYFANWMAAPTVDGTNIRYPDATSIDQLFSGARKLVESDGICRLQILGRQRETTPRGTVLQVGAF